MERICRICLRAEDNLEFMEIFSKSSEIALKINLVSGMKVSHLLFDCSSPFSNLSFLDRGISELCSCSNVL